MGNISGWMNKINVYILKLVCVFVRERKTERWRDREQLYFAMLLYVCVCVCVLNGNFQAIASGPCQGAGEEQTF